MKKVLVFLALLVSSNASHAIVFSGWEVVASVGVNSSGLLVHSCSMRPATGYTPNHIATYFKEMQLYCVSEDIVWFAGQYGQQHYHQFADSKTIVHGFPFATPPEAVSIYHTVSAHIAGCLHQGMTLADGSAQDRWSPYAWVSGGHQYNLYGACYPSGGGGGGGGEDP